MRRTQQWRLLASRDSPTEGWTHGHHLLLFVGGSKAFLWDSHPKSKTPI